MPGAELCDKVLSRASSVSSSGMHKNKITCAQDAPDSCRYSVSIRNGGPGQVRTGDLEFRKPLSLVLGCSRDYCLSRLKSWSSRTFSKDQWTSLGVHCSKNVVVF